MAGSVPLALLALVVPAQATFVGQNGKIAFLSSGSDCLQMVNPDGTGHTQPGACDIAGSMAISPGGDRVLRSAYNVDYDVNDLMHSKLDGTDPIATVGSHYTFPVVSWSHDGKWIAGVYDYVCASCAGGYVDTAPADGTGPRRTVALASPYTPAAWGTGGRIAYAETTFYGDTYTQIGTVLPDGSTSPITVVSEPGSDGQPDWSPDSQRIVFTRESEVAVVNADGSGLQNLTSSTGYDSNPKWSPDGQKILFSSNRDGNYEIYSMNPDGTAQTNLTNSGAADFRAIWSPDSQKIAFISDRDGDNDIYVMNRAGTGLVNVTANSTADYQPDWQSIPINAYPRPKGATPFLTYLVPAYNACASPNRVHGPPLAFASCNPPTQVSDELTVGSADSNGKPTKSISSVRFETVVGIPSTPADEADVAITAQITDVYTQAGLADYAGELRATTPLRITDKLNTPHPGGPGAGTVSDIPYGFTIPCAVTADTTTGGSCLLSTSADALAPGAVKEGRRAIWGLGAVEVYEGGVGGDLFMKQGIFVP